MALTLRPSSDQTFPLHTPGNQPNPAHASLTKIHNTDNAICPSPPVTVMSLARLLKKKFNPPSPARAASVDAGTDLPPENRNELPMPLPVAPNVFLPNLSPGPLPETSLGPRPAAPEGLTETWNLVKDGPPNSNLDRGLDSTGAFWMYALGFCRVR